MSTTGYCGPYLEPVWEFLFENAANSLSTERGFHDAGTGEFLSLSALRDAAIAASAALTQVCDLGPEDTMAIVSQNCIEYALIMMAASRVGAIVTTLPVGASSSELAYFFSTSRTKVVVASEEEFANVKTACGNVGILESRLLVFGDSSSRSTCFSKLVTVGGQREPSPYWKPMKRNNSCCAFLSFTSGTTGKPKAVMISHANIIGQLRQVCQMVPVQRNKAVLGILPFYHITGLIHLLHLPVLLGQDLILLRQFKMSTMLEAISRYKCDELWLVPPLLIRLLRDREAHNFDFSFVKQFNTGAAPLNAEIVDQLAQKFPKVALRQAWGMTETTSCVTITPPDLMSWDNAAKVGNLVPGTELRIVDPATGSDVARGDQGELWVKGPQVTMGYLDRDMETAETYMPDGFLRTGDIGRIDSEGFVTIHDRLKEMIKVRGHAVAPAELEDALLGHRAVADAAVVGIPDEYSGEIPKAFVVAKAASLESPETVHQLKELVRTTKARHKWLAGGVTFVKELPKSPSGKILRRKLKAQWIQGQGHNMKARL
ncbi:hypothetical protein F5X68DRAFT_224037 [Plectosphaerella plurivora]|uniref:Uncharacterized protein n=1 Tax=Plectosphaerella plurivora TaxID=936078 RepID=A0A9P9A7U4_9PEZI|nr:hypothetical protein F5X68DRAFT_224037 [Plectosphaerella plurivora]